MNARQKQWEKFHRDNPQMYQVFKRFACEALASGRPRFSVYMIGNRVRWYEQVEAAKSNGFKINNNLLPFYARLLKADDKRFVDFLQLRQGRWVNDIPDSYFEQVAKETLGGDYRE